MHRLCAMRNSQGARGRLSSKLSEHPVGLEQRLLDDVLAVQDRPGHPGAVAVQARAEVGDRLEERHVAGLEGAVGRRVGWDL